MEIQIGITKACLFSANESKESFEVIERPSGGESIVFCDGRVNGEKSKKVSAFAVNKIIGMLSEGVRDSVAMRAISDQLYAINRGEVEAHISIVSADLDSGTMVISRNSSTPVYYVRRDIVDNWKCGSRPAGIGKHIEPCVTEIPIEAGTVILLVSEGVYEAGKAYGKQIDLHTLLQSITDDDNETNAKYIADFILNYAISLDQEKPHTDMSVIAFKVASSKAGRIRRMSFLIPIPDFYY